MFRGAYLIPTQGICSCFRSPHGGKNGTAFLLHSADKVNNNKVGVTKLPVWETNNITNSLCFVDALAAGHSSRKSKSDFKTFILDQPCNCRRRLSRDRQTACDAFGDPRRESRWGMWSPRSGCFLEPEARSSSSALHTGGREQR